VSAALALLLFGVLKQVRVGFQGEQQAHQVPGARQAGSLSFPKISINE
jgi:hypothetical protein